MRSRNTRPSRVPGSSGGRAVAVGAGLLAGALALTGCSSGDDASGGTPSPGATPTAGDTLTLVTHDSFALPKGVLATFTRQTGITVKVVQPGDGGTLVNQLVLTKDAPLGDVAYGVDNTFATRATDAGVFVPYTSDAPAAADGAKYAVDDSGDLTPIDIGDVCLNVDHSWFTRHDVPEPATFDDLTKPAYRDLTVVENPSTSSPGLAFLLATIGRYGDDGWQDYWKQLDANGVQVDQSWTDAYYTDFTAGGGGGSRPIVVSYSSSPPETIPKGGGRPTSGALLGTCFRQVEYAGVLAHAKNPVGAQELVDFLLSDTVQSDLPGSMYVYPVSSSVSLPADWQKWAPLADKPWTVSPQDIAAHRSEWLDAWSDLAG